MASARFHVPGSKCQVLGWTRDTNSSLNPEPGTRNPERLHDYMIARLHDPGAQGTEGELMYFIVRVSC